MPTKAKVTTMKSSLYIFRLHVHALAKAYLGRDNILQSRRTTIIAPSHGSPQDDARFVNLKYQA
jgi:hypothetical protein